MRVSKCHFVFDALSESSSPPNCSSDTHCRQKQLLIYHQEGKKQAMESSKKKVAIAVGLSLLAVLFSVALLFHRKPDEGTTRTQTQYDIIVSSPAASVTPSAPSASPSISFSPTLTALSIPEKLNSDFFNEDNPPVDWADTSLLIPHEAIRHQMKMMVQSVQAIPDDLENNEAWKVTLFSKWYIDYFYESVHEHHDNEEDIYFPWIKTRAVMPHEQFSSSHEELVSNMGSIKKICATILDKGGIDCNDEIASLKNQIRAFEVDMRAHLKEEEEVIPQLLRNHFTHEEEERVVQQISFAGGLEFARKFLPAILLSAEEW